MIELLAMKKLQICFLIIFAILLGTALLAEQGLFFMGEDVTHPNGVVLSVNEMSRQPLISGLGTQAKQDEIKMNMTFVNTGYQTWRIDPLADFEVELHSRFSSTEDMEGWATVKPFNLHPTTQTRVNLYFKVNAEQQVSPILLFKSADQYVKILCDPKIERIMNNRSAGLGLTVEESLQLGRTLVDAERFDIAERAVAPALAAAPSDSRLLLLMAAVEEAGGNNAGADHYLQQIVPSTVRNLDEGHEIARMAVSLGRYPLAVSVLEPFERVNQLDTEQMTLLARAYYYDRSYDAAESLLLKLSRQNVQSSDVYFTLGNIYERQNSMEQAVQQWEKAVELQPDHAQAYFNLGVGYLRTKDIDRARAYWQRVLELNPDLDTLQATEDALRATE